MQVSILLMITLFSGDFLICPKKILFKNLDIFSLITTKFCLFVKSNQVRWVRMHPLKGIMVMA